MDLGLKGKRALVTGATKGVGRAIAESLLSEGVSVAICGRDPKDVRAAVADMSASGNVIGAALDVGQPEATREWVDNSAAQLGGIDIYVHAASPKLPTTLGEWRHNFDVDLMALAYGVEAATDALIDGGGAIVTVGTVASVEHFGTGASGYTAMKSAATQWTLGQAQLLGAQGVRCNVVTAGPTFFDGGDWDNIKSGIPEFFDLVEKNHPTGRLGCGGDVGDAVAFLVSERATHINGVNLTVDGGLLKRIDF